MAVPQFCCFTEAAWGRRNEKLHRREGSPPSDEGSFGEAQWPPKRRARAHRNSHASKG